MKRQHNKYQKVLLAYFSTGNLNALKIEHEKWKDDIFEYVPINGNSNFNRLIFYACLNAQFEIIEWYLNTSQKPIELSNREVRLLATKISSKNRLKKFVEKCNENKKISDFLKYDVLLLEVKKYITSHYNYDDIELFLDIFPDAVDSMIPMCSSSTSKGLQLKRHLKLTKIL
jgi:uncharacterized protein YeeX (DUF496 family)